LEHLCHLTAISSQGPTEAESDFSKDLQLPSLAHMSALIAKERFAQGVNEIATNSSAPIETVGLIENRFASFERPVRANRCAKKAIDVMDVWISADFVVGNDHNRVRLFLFKGIKKNIPLPHSNQGIGA
jgi:hypothetical protein